MKDMEDVKKWIREKMATHSELLSGHEAANCKAMASRSAAKIDVLHDLHTKLCIYFPKQETEPEK